MDGFVSVHLFYLEVIMAPERRLEAALEIIQDYIDGCGGDPDLSLNEAVTHIVLALDELEEE